MNVRKKRLLFIDLANSMGGVETYLENLTALLRDHADIRLLTTLPDLEAKMRRSEIYVYRIPSLFDRTKSSRFVAAILYLPFILVRDGIDTIQINGFLESIFIPLARICGKKTVYTRHGPTELELYTWYREPLRFFPRYVSLRLLRLSSRVVCVSDAVGRSLAGILPSERIEVVSNWVPDYSPNELSPLAGSQWATILYVGRLEKYKGIQILVDAFRSLEAARLIVVGEGSYRKQLELLAKGTNTQFEGFQRDVGVFYQSADVFVMPSFGPEGLPMVTLEAMGRGLPCILSDLPVHREVAGPDAAALLFTPGDVIDLRSKLTAILSDESLRIQYARKGYGRVQEKYSRKLALHGYRDIFDIRPTT